MLGWNSYKKQRKLHETTLPGKKKQHIANIVSDSHQPPSVIVELVIWLATHYLIHCIPLRGDGHSIL